MGYGPRAIEASRRVVEQVAQGKYLVDACKSCGIVTSVFNEVVSGVREIAIAYQSARESRSDLLADEALKAADDPNLDPQRARNMIEVRKWAASKWNRKVYGDVISVDVQQQISVKDALAEAHARVLDVIEAEVIQSAISMKTEENSNVPDIFS
jgi:uncharacterized Zn finger protein